MLYRGMDRATLDAAYNNTAAVGQATRDRYVADWAARSDKLRAARGGALDVRYGTKPRQRLDVFRGALPAAPTLVYIHGGYWQMNDKEPYAFRARACSKRGSTWRWWNIRWRRRRGSMRSSPRSAPPLPG